MDREISIFLAIPAVLNDGMSDAIFSSLSVPDGHVYVHPSLYLAYPCVNAVIKLLSAHRISTTNTVADESHAYITTATNQSIE